MKKILSIIAIIGLAGGTAFAGCGKKVENAGKLSAYDTKAKTITVDGKSIKITATTKGADKLAGLVGKDVKVVSEHGKADSVEAKKG